MTLPALEAGDIVVTSVNPKSWSSRLVAWVSGSKWTHIFIIKDEYMLLESGFPEGAKNGHVPTRFQEIAENGQEYVVLRAPYLSSEELRNTIQTADSWLGRKYDVLQAITFGLFRFFIADGPKRVICSRYVSGAFMSGGRNLFPLPVLLRRAGAQHPRFLQISKGWTIPADFIDFADVYRIG